MFSISLLNAILNLLIPLKHGTELVIQLQLRMIPHFTTLQKVVARISQEILHTAIGRFIGMVSPGKIFAGIDGTGFERRHAILQM